MQQRPLLAIELELVLFAEPDGMRRSCRKAASAIETVANQDRLLQILLRNLQFEQGALDHQADSLNKGSWTHQAAINEREKGGAVGCIVPAGAASLRNWQEASKFITLACWPTALMLDDNTRIASTTTTLSENMDHDDSDSLLPAFAEMSLDEIEELLEELGLELPDDELQQVALFIQQSGGLDAALEALHELERKAA